MLRVSGSVSPIEMRGVPIEKETWSLQREIELFNTCDIVVYPLPND